LPVREGKDNGEDAIELIIDNREENTMKRMLYTLFAATVALSLLIPAGVFAARDTGALCPMHAGKTCLKKDGANCCGLNEDVSQNKLMSLKKGQLEWVRVNTARSEGIPCPNTRVVAGTTTARYFAGPKVGWITVPTEKESLLCRVCG
jgi:hypothetical protein